MNMIDKDRILDDVLYRLGGQYTYYDICQIVDEWEEAKEAYEKMDEQGKRKLGVIRDLQRVERGY